MSTTSRSRVNGRDNKYMTIHLFALLIVINYATAIGHGFNKNVSKVPVSKHSRWSTSSGGDLGKINGNWRGKAAVRSNETKLQEATEDLLQYGVLLRTEIVNMFGKLVYDHYDDFGMSQIEALYRIHQETLARKYNIFDIVPSVLKDPDIKPSKICAHINKHVHTCLKETSSICMNLKIHNTGYKSKLLKSATTRTSKLYHSGNIKKNYRKGFSLKSVLYQLRAGKLRLTPSLFSGMLQNVQYDNFDHKVRSAERHIVTYLGGPSRRASRSGIPEKLTKALASSRTVREMLMKYLVLGSQYFGDQVAKLADYLSKHIVREVNAVSENIELLGTVYDNSTINLKYLFELILPNDTLDRDVLKARNIIIHELKTKKIVEKFLTIDKYQQTGPDQLLLEILNQLREIRFAKEVITSLYLHAQFWHRSHMVKDLNELLELFDAYENLRGLPKYQGLIKIVDGIKRDLRDSKNVTIELLCTRPRECLRIGLELVANCEIINARTKNAIDAFIERTNFNCVALKEDQESQSSESGYEEIDNASAENTVVENYVKTSTTPRPTTKIATTTLKIVTMTQTPQKTTTAKERESVELNENEDYSEKEISIEHEADQSYAKELQKKKIIKPSTLKPPMNDTSRKCGDNCVTEICKQNCTKSPGKEDLGEIKEVEEVEKEDEDEDEDCEECKQAEEELLIKEKQKTLTVPSSTTPIPRKEKPTTKRPTTPVIKLEVPKNKTETPICDNRDPNYHRKLDRLQKVRLIDSLSKSTSSHETSIEFSKSVEPSTELLTNEKIGRKKKSNHHHLAKGNSVPIEFSAEVEDDSPNAKGNNTRRTILLTKHLIKKGLKKPIHDLKEILKSRATEKEPEQEEIDSNSLGFDYLSGEMGDSTDLNRNNTRRTLLTTYLMKKAMKKSKNRLKKLLHSDEDISKDPTPIHVSLKVNGNNTDLIKKITRRTISNAKGELKRPPGKISSLDIDTEESFDTNRNNTDEIGKGGSSVKHGSKRYDTRETKLLKEYLMKRGVKGPMKRLKELLESRTTEEELPELEEIDREVVGDHKGVTKNSVPIHISEETGDISTNSKTMNTRRSALLKKLVGTTGFLKGVYHLKEIAKSRLTQTDVPEREEINRKVDDNANLNNTRRTILLTHFTKKALKKSKNRLKELLHPDDISKHPDTIQISLEVKGEGTDAIGKNTRRMVWNPKEGSKIALGKIPKPKKRKGKVPNADINTEETIDTNESNTDEIGKVGISAKTVSKSYNARRTKLLKKYLAKNGLQGSMKGLKEFLESHTTEEELPEGGKIDRDVDDAVDISENPISTDISGEMRNDGTALNFNNTRRTVLLTKHLLRKARKRSKDRIKNFLHKDDDLANPDPLQISVEIKGDGPDSINKNSRPTISNAKKRFWKIGKEETIDVNENGTRIPGKGNVNTKDSRRAMLVMNHLITEGLKNSKNNVSKLLELTLTGAEKDHDDIQLKKNDITTIIVTLRDIWKRKFGKNGQNFNKFLKLTPTGRKLLKYVKIANEKIYSSDKLVPENPLLKSIMKTTKKKNTDLRENDSKILGSHKRNDSSGKILKIPKKHRVTEKMVEYGTNSDASDSIDKVSNEMKDHSKNVFEKRKKHVTPKKISENISDTSEENSTNLKEFESKNVESNEVKNVLKKTLKKINKGSKKDSLKNRHPKKISGATKKSGTKLKRIESKTKKRIEMNHNITSKSSIPKATSETTEEEDPDLEETNSKSSNEILTPGRKQLLSFGRTVIREKLSRHHHFIPKIHKRVSEKIKDYDTELNGENSESMESKSKSPSKSVLKKFKKDSVLNSSSASHTNSDKLSKTRRVLSKGGVKIKQNGSPKSLIPNKMSEKSEDGTQLKENDSESTEMNVEGLSKTVLKESKKRSKQLLKPADTEKEFSNEEKNNAINLPKRIREKSKKHLPHARKKKVSKITESDGSVAIESGELNSKKRINKRITVFRRKKPNINSWMIVTKKKEIEKDSPKNSEEEEMQGLSIYEKKKTHMGKESSEGNQIDEVNGYDDSDEKFPGNSISKDREKSGKKIVRSYTRRMYYGGDMGEKTSKYGRKTSQHIRASYGPIRRYWSTGKRHSSSSRYVNGLNNSTSDLDKLLREERFQQSGLKKPRKIVKVTKRVKTWVTDPVVDTSFSNDEDVVSN